MTTKSSVYNIKPKFSSSYSVNNITTNGGDIKTSRISVKRPLSTTNFYPTSCSTNAYNNHLKRRPLHLNNYFHPKLNSNHFNEQINGYQSHEHSPSPPLIFHAIAPVSSDEFKKTSAQISNEQKANDESNSPASRRIARVLAHTNIKAMTTDSNLISAESSCSEDENQTNSHLISSAIDGDADESDNDNKKTIKKSRRLQKTRQTSNSSIQKTDINNNSKDEQQRSSSFEDGYNDRRTKPSSTKKLTHLTTTTTSDDDIIKEYHRYHPLDITESEINTTKTESNVSSPIPTMSTSVNESPIKKINRFQVKSIRKSQQQFLLADANAAKSSNDDDCSVPNGKLNSQLIPSVIERKNTSTPTTDGENATTKTDNLVNGAGSALNTTEHGYHRVRFQVIPHVKHDSIAEEEKVPNQTAATANLPAPAQPSSTASVQGEDDEEEVIGKSPDNRFIKYAKEIGRGAFKTVYRGMDTEAGVPVAWCELQEFAQFDKHERARFREEAEMLKKLQHPSIVRFYDFWEETNPRTNKKVIILVTELMTSGSLKKYIRKFNFKGQKEENRVKLIKKWCPPILKGLAHLHSRNPPIIHRDLKCDNIFITGTNGSVKIGDLGLATFKTQTGGAKSMRGTMEFMAPEMFDERYDELIDIYSFGLCMLEMMTGEYPYNECRCPTAVINRVTKGLKPECYYKVENKDVREVLDCCIRTKKEERLSAQELLQHSFFLDDNGLRIDLVRDPLNDSQVVVKDNSIDFKLKIIDKTKHKALWTTEHEALRFPYNTTSDTPEQIVDELLKQKKIYDVDKKFVIQSIKDRLRAYHYETIDRKAGVFCQDIIKSSSNQTSVVSQQPQQVPPPQQQTPVIPQPQVTPAVPVPSVVQQPPIEIQQQQQQIVKPVSEVSQPKPSVTTEPIPIAQISELSSSVSGSAGSLEALNEQLKKTFTKSNAPQGTPAPTPTPITNDINDPSTPLPSQDESSISKATNDTSIIDQQQMEESGGTFTSELTTNILPLSTPTTSQTQSQPTTMLTNHQQKVFQTPLLVTQPSQSCSYLTIPPSSNDINKQIISSSSALVETIENSQNTISPSNTIEAIHSSSLPSDTSTQTSISGSLKELDYLLTSTFKNSTKSTGNDETETLKIDENSPKIITLEPAEEKQKLIDLFNSANPPASSAIQSQPNTSSLIIPKIIQQVKSQPTSQFSANFDPFVSPERNIQELEILFKTPQDQSLSNDSTIVASTTSSPPPLNDFSEIKSMLTDLSKTLINRMNVIENKIDEHRNQTVQINNLLTKTVLPSLLDLADIIHQTPNIHPSVRTKLEDIQTNIRATQQQTETKDLMDI